MSATILRAGPLTTVQDLGRNGFRGIGVGTSGALDCFAARVANLLAGNDEAAALIEVTLGMFRIRFNDARVLAWCGGAFEARIGGEQIPAGRAVAVAAREELAIDRPNPGCRAWLAISGGINLPLVLGSRSTDLRANFGGMDGRSLRAGDELPLGAVPARAQAFSRALGSSRIGHWSAPANWAITAVSRPVLRVVRGADWDRFEESAQKALFERKVLRHCGSRPDGRAPRRTRTQSLRSGRSHLRSGHARNRSDSTKRKTDSSARRLPNDRRISENRARDHCRFADSRAAQAGRSTSLQRSLSRAAHELLLTRESELERFRIGLEFHAA